jgi:hypothetical protein
MRAQVVTALAIETETLARRPRAVDADDLGQTLEARKERRRALVQIDQHRRRTLMLERMVDPDRGLRRERAAMPGNAAGNRSRAAARAGGRAPRSSRNPAVRTRTWPC